MLVTSFRFLIDDRGVVRVAVERENPIRRRIIDDRVGVIVRAALCPAL